MTTGLRYAAARLSKEEKMFIMIMYLLTGLSKPGGIW